MPLTRDAKVQAIKGVPLFSRRAKKNSRRSRSSPMRSTSAPGGELIREGALGREFFVLIDGEAEVQRKGRKVRTLKRVTSSARSR